ncbi:tetratricopeptide repeat-containing sensor histidine kinase [Flavobacterium sp. UBA6135]|uniref:tetratricopeptide repeat-containing sensor histidine kinase n=1 Tax=Flavobacterium sp. UBA6135 TaxID=1946553 RepID=UPI0025C0E045|nr:sensor histidine kinase [Flavobacterium sp. UBA6135]
MIVRYVFFVLLLFLGCFFAHAQNASKDSVDFYIEQNELIKGLNYAKIKTDHYIKSKQFKKLKDISIKKSNIFTKLNENDKAIQIIYDAIIHIEKNKATIPISDLYIELGKKYSIVRDTTMSLKSYHKGMKLAREINDTIPLKNAYQNLFRLHVHNNLDSSYYYMKKKFALDKIHQSNAGLASSYNNHFVYYSKKNEYEKAKKYLDSCYSTSLKSNSIEMKISALSNLGYYYMVHKEDFKHGASYYHETLDKFENEMTDNELVDVYLNLSYAYENLKDYQQANVYMSIAYELKDKVINTNINDAIKKVETRYQIEKIENEFDQISKNMQEKQLRNKKIIIVFASLFAFSCVLFYFFYQNLQLKQRNKIREIDSEIQENIINASIDGQELERKKLADTLHDNISALLSSAGLHLSAYIANKEGEPAEEIRKARSLLKDAHDRVRDLSHELVPPVLAKLGIVYALQDLCEKNSNSAIQFHLITQLSTQKKYNTDFEIKIYFIVTELLNNTIKHSKASEVNLTLDENNNQLHVNVKDNGRGFDTTKSSGTDGYGLTQIKARIKGLNGKIQITSKNNEGTTVDIKVPIPSSTTV